MKTRNGKSGFALPVALVLLLVVGVGVASVGGFVAHAMRMTRVHTGRTRCRLAAQAAVEYAKARIQTGFSGYVGGSGAASVKIDPRQAEAYDWFDDVSADRKTIGKSDARHDAVRIDAGLPASLNGCAVAVAIGMSVDHPAGSSCAIVPVVASATLVYPDGLKVTSTIQERVAFGTGQSAVFDNAYFVNNYGWMSGSSIVINGDMRANGNISLSGSVVNGFVYAAANDELGAAGEVSLRSSPRIYGSSSYRSNAGTRSRWDADDCDAVGSFDAPAATATITLPQFDADGNVVGGTVAVKSGKPIVNEMSDAVPMPYVSDLANYVSYAQEKGGTLSYPAVTYVDETGESHVTPAGTVNAHYEGVGPSRDPSGADKGALVLIGTAANPIRINGPVVVDSDVIIKGVVSGQGTIYSGRNVHVIGNLTYKNAPAWTHNTTASSAEAQALANGQKDMLGLVAKGNIVIGDCSGSSWANSVGSYINGGSSSVVARYACDGADAQIGYPATFAGSYTAVESVSGLSGPEAAAAPGGYDAASGRFGKTRTVSTTTYTYKTTTDRWGRQTQTRVANTVKTVETVYNRKYYETVCDDRVLSTLKDASGVSQIDAIIYNNHGIFGTIGRSGATFNLNGAIVCRDEALIATAGNGIRFNWDQRLKRSNANKATSALSLPVGPQEPYTVEWLEVPDDLNPAFREGSAP